MKKGIIIALAAVFALSAFALVGCGESSSSTSGTMIIENNLPNSWSVSAKTYKGQESKTIDFSAEALEALRVSNTNSEGTVTLKLSQGDTEKTFDLSPEFSESLDTSSFTPGKITLSLEFEAVRDLDLKIAWK